MKINIDRTIENHSYAHYCFLGFFSLPHQTRYLIKPRFYYISAGLMRSASQGDVSMMLHSCRQRRKTLKEVHVIHH